MQFSELEQKVLNRAEKLMGDIQQGGVDRRRHYGK